MAIASPIVGGRHLAERAVRDHPGRDAQVLRPDVPPRSGAHARRRQADPQFRPQDRRPFHDWTMRASPRGDRKDPHPGRQGQQYYPASVRRRQFSRRGRADPQPSATSSLVCSSITACCASTKPRPWLSHHYNIPLGVHVDASKQFLGELKASPTPRPSARPFPLQIEVFEAEAKKMAALTSWRRARSILSVIENVCSSPAAPR